MSNHPCRRAVSGCACVFALFLFAATPATAERIEPPLEWMHSPVNHLVIGTLIEINPAGRLVFNKVTALEAGAPEADDAAATVDVRVPLATLKAVKRGQRYIFAYSDLRADPRQPINMVRNVGGATMLVGPGLEPALFRDTQQTRALLTSKLDGDDHEGDGEQESASDRDHDRVDEHAREHGDVRVDDGKRDGDGERLVERLLAALQGNDPALQNLAAAEIAYGAEIGERIEQPRHRAIVGKVARTAKTAPNVRVILLRAAGNDERRFGDWWKNGANEVVTTTPVGGYAKEAADPSDLVLTALELLDKNAVPVAPDALKRWLWSPNAALAERASLMLRRVSPAEQRTAIQQALADPKLPASTRKFLGDHLRRMDRIDAKSKAPKEGTG